MKFAIIIIQKGIRDFKRSGLSAIYFNPFTTEPHGVSEGYFLEKDEGSI